MRASCVPLSLWEQVLHACEVDKLGTPLKLVITRRVDISFSQTPWRQMTQRGPRAR